MQSQLDVTTNQGFSKYAENLISYVMKLSHKNRREAIFFLDKNASDKWRKK